jgi:hypothetical protein
MIDLGQITGTAAEAFKAYASQTDVDFKKMEETAKKYGIALDDLGKPYWAAKLHDSAQTLIDDFDVLTKNGTNVDVVLHGMSGSISKLVQDSLKFGIAIPENMRPWIEQLQKTHQLIDENGNEITDLSGLQFAPPIVSGFDKIVNKLQELIDKITGTTKAIANIPKDIPVNIHYNDPGPPVHDTDRGTSQGFANGGVVEPQYAAMGRIIRFPGGPRGMDTVPAWLTPGEGVVNRRGMRILGSDGLSALNSGASSTKDSGAVVDAIETLSTELTRQRRELPKMIRDAILTSGRKSA